MCYTPKISFGLFITGIIFTYLFYVNKKIIKDEYFYMIVLFYSFMELLQTIQYFYVNQCNNPINIISTNIAYLFIIVQPLMWNTYFYLISDEKDKKLFLTAMIMCIIWIFINLFARYLYNKDFRKYKKSNRDFSVFQYYPNTCTHKHKYHLFWTWSSAFMRDFHPNLLMYLVLWAVPALMTKKTFNIIIISIISFIITVLFTHFVLDELYTLSSTWCYISVPTVLYIAFIKFYYLVS